MTCLELYDTVAALIGENPDSAASGLIRSRIPAFINTAASELSELDIAYRRYVIGESEVGFPKRVKSLDDELPVCLRLAPAMAFYVAALAVRDENPDMAETLGRDYVNAYENVARVIPACVSAVADVYR